MQKQVKPPLSETFAGLVYDMFRAAGMSISIAHQENVEKVAPRFAEAVKREARETALVLAKRLQAATAAGFEEFAKTVDRHDEEVKENQNEIERLSTEVAELRKQLDKVYNEFVKLGSK